MGQDALLTFWFSRATINMSFKWVEHTILDKVFCTPKLSKSDFKWLLWPWEWGQGQTCGMSWKALPRGVPWYINKGLSIWTLCHTAISSPHWFTLDRWTLAYNSEVKGHSDLILWLQGAASQRYSHARLEASRFIIDELCQPNRQN